MSINRVKLTLEGRNKMIKDLKYLKGPKRREIAKALAEARAHGDLSENAEYDAAKESQAMNEKKISEIEGVLVNAEIIDDSLIAKDQALLGATITVKDQKHGDQFDYILVSEEESDFDIDKISVSSPVGKALLGHKKGDIIEIDVPAGKLVYQIINITR